jgi:sterol desaturase/sphingolipid hydroxylase (fatty acid hydroxylase superfamily)
MVYMYPFLIAAGVEYTTGYTVRYSAINEHGWTYFFVSIFVFLLVVDADFYWTHRFLHRKFRSCHAVHHQFVDPTPWCGFAFHFGESFLLAFPYVPLLLLLPWHPAAVLAVQTVAMTWNAYLHLGYDPIPESFKQRRPLRWILTARDHCGHHQHPQSNFGLYFSYWDNLCGTRFKKDSL